MREPTLPTGSLGTDRRFDGMDSNTRSRERQGDEPLCVPSRPIYICRHTGRQVFDRGGGSMCLISWIFTVFTVAAAASGPALAAAPAPPAAADPLLPYLQDDDPRARAQVLG